MPLSDSQNRAAKKYQGKFDDIKLRVPKGDRAKLQEHAASKSESLNAFLVRAANEAMERDNNS